MDEVQLLMDLVSVPSPTGNIQAISDLLMDRGPAMGLKTWTDPAGNVHMAIGEDRPRVLLLCHMDTVPGELPVRMEDNVLHGRGSVDAKGCLAAAMVAAFRSVATGRGSVEVVAVPDEEGPSSGVRYLMQGPAPDAVFVGEPSSWEGITIGYKGLLHLRYRNTTSQVHAGAGLQNSAEGAVALWTGLKALCEEEHDDLDGPGMFWRPMPTLLSISTHDDGLHMTTEMEVDVRLPPGHDTSRLLAYLEDIEGGATLEVVGPVPGVMAPKNNPLVRALLASIRAEGGEPTFRRKTGTSDMNLAHDAWPEVPIAAYGPGDSMLDHTPGERLDLAEYSRAINVMERAVGLVIKDLGERSKV